MKRYKVVVKKELIDTSWDNINEIFLTNKGLIENKVIVKDGFVIIEKSNKTIRIPVNNIAYIEEIIEEKL